jgi:hypothetical protein
MKLFFLGQELIEQDGNEANQAKAMLVSDKGKLRTFMKS